MKNLLVLICLFTLSINVFSQGNNGLIAHWNFNGNANDVSGNNLNGVVYGPTQVAGYAGIANTAYYFNGNGDHIDIPYNSIMNVDSTFSICTLIKPMGFYSGNAQGNFILTRGAEYANDYYQLGYCDNAYDNSDNVFSPNNEVFYSSIIGGPDETSWYPGNTLVQVDTWYCVALTYTGDSIKLFIDGVKIKVLATHKVYSPGTDKIGIGYNPARVSDFPYWINGIIDDIRLYKRSLSDAEAISYCDTAKMSQLIGPNSINSPTNINSDFIVYPNPVHNKVTFQLPFDRKNQSIQIFNALGQSIIEISPEQYIVNLDISTLPVGVYFVKLNCEGDTIFRKLIKE